MNPKKLVRKVLPKSAAKLAEESYRRSRIWAAQARYGFPAREARVIAVTGTNGKTTTCAIINAMLKSAGYRTAMFTTAEFEMAGKVTPNTIHRTVPLTVDLMRFLKQAKQKKVDFIVLEATSQALHQHKLTAIPIEVAVMTNLTQDHLDYHGSMENYATSKARLFNNYMSPKKVVLNRDDEWYDYFARQSVVEPVTYGQNPSSSLRIERLSSDARGSTLDCAFYGEKLQITTQLIGRFNAYNAAAAAATGLVLGLAADKVRQGVRSLTAVPGRMEAVEAGQDFGVIVDYAHAPDALKNVLETLQDIIRGRVIVVFGATGDRDKGKRPLMGEAAARHADLIYLTDDETYSEDPEKIRQGVLEGIVRAGGQSKTTEIADRTAAIKSAFNSAKRGDVVILTGLGHQDYRNMGGKKLPWDDRQVAREILGEKHQIIVDN